MVKKKNIHVLPTDKPSRLHLIEDTLMITSDYKNSVCDGEVNIYITSDEEIKDGDWIIENNNLGKCTNELWAKRGASILTKKIILTTDQDLINNGVQKIDDEFLEWFVKNPTCEKVEIRKEMYMPQSNGKISDGKITHEISLEPSQNTLPYYKIIIPKEELKQERMYSEEEVLNFTKYMLSKKVTVARSISDLEEYLPKEFQLLSGELMRNGKELISEWFEQFKKQQDG